MRCLRWLPTLLLVLPWLFGPAAPSNERRIRDLSGGDAFRLLDWETVHLTERAGRLWHGLVGEPDVDNADVQTLRAYFARPVAQRAATRPGAEAALERLIAQRYEGAGVARSEPLPLSRLFPPVLVALTQPPNVLVISPRSELRVTTSVVIKAIDVPAQEQLERSADSTGVSSLVAPIGGLATYPSMVLEEDAPERVLTSVAHEWLHQYLIFYPLGAGYWVSQETREINETTADLVGQEVGSQALAQLDLSPRSTQPPPDQRRQPDAFDFRAFMRDTRLRTERLLAEGRIDEAEAFLRAQRDILQQHGYAIRKLNQAYFALYGSYGGGFAASPANPIPDLLAQLRQRSGSLDEFLVQVRGVTSVAELRASLARLNDPARAQTTPPSAGTTPGSG